VSLRSDDPWDAPKLDIGYLTDKEGADLATLRSAADFSLGFKLHLLACMQTSQEAIPAQLGHSDLHMPRKSPQHATVFVRFPVLSEHTYQNLNKIATCAFVQERHQAVPGDCRAAGIRRLRRRRAAPGRGRLLRRGD
jgi:hypothetical protein